MQQCIDCFQEFFHTLVSVKLLQERFEVQGYFARLVDDADLTLTQQDPCPCGLITLTGCEQDRVQAFSTACQLLVEFASFPMYSQALPPNSEPSMSKHFIFMSEKKCLKQNVKGSDSIFNFKLGNSFIGTFVFNSPPECGDR